MGASIWRSEAEERSYKLAKAVNLSLSYTTKKAVSTTKISTVVVANEIHSKGCVVVRTINSHDKKRHPKGMQKELVFQVQNALRDVCTIQELPRIAEISAYLPNVQVVTYQMKNWQTLKHH